MSEADMRKKKHEREKEKERMTVEESESDTKWHVFTPTGRDAFLSDMTRSYVT